MRSPSSLIVAAGLLLFTPAAGRAADLPLPAAPGRLVDIGDRKLHVLASGNGGPTVVLEAGASAFAIDWTLVQRELDKTHRVVAYDRIGMGWSDPARDPAARPWEDLHALLERAGEKPPYILVGASLGGIFARLFAADYPDEVAGLVLVDPATEDRLFTAFEGKPTLIASLTAEQLRTILPREPVPVPRRPVQTGTPFDLLPPDLYETRKNLDARLIASIPESVPADIVAAAREADRARLARLHHLRADQPQHLGDRPLIVLTRGATRNPELEAVHAQLAKLSRNSRHRVVADAGHEIHLFKPAVVVQAIRDVIEASTSSQPLRAR